VPDPVNWEHWEKAKALLEPARERGNFASVLDPDEVLCAVMDGNELLAVATAWLSTERYVEVKLVGGRDHHRWLGQLDNVIGAGARMVGASREEAGNAHEAADVLVAGKPRPARSWFDLLPR